MIGILGYLATFSTIMSVALLVELKVIRRQLTHETALNRVKLRSIESEVKTIAVMTNHRNTSDNIMAARRFRGGL